MMFTAYTGKLGRLWFKNCLIWEKFSFFMNFISCILENNWETILNFWCWKAIKRNFNIWLQEYAHTLSTSSHKVKRNIISKCLENFFYSKLKFLKWAPEYFFDDDENHFPVNKIISGASGHAAPTCICCIYIFPHHV